MSLFDMFKLGYFPFCFGAFCAQSVGGKHMLAAYWHVLPAQVLVGLWSSPWGALWAPLGLPGAPGGTSGRPFRLLLGVAWCAGGFFWGASGGLSGSRGAPRFLLGPMWCSGLLRDMAPGFRRGPWALLWPGWEA